MPIAHAGCSEYFRSFLFHPIAFGIWPSGKQFVKCHHWLLHLVVWIVACPSSVTDDARNFPSLDVCSYRHLCVTMDLILGKRNYTILSSTSNVLPIGICQSTPNAIFSLSDCPFCTFDIDRTSGTSLHCRSKEISCNWIEDACI